jgi:hypothetical protein
MAYVTQIFPQGVSYWIRKEEEILMFERKKNTKLNSLGHGLVGSNAICFGR